MRSTSGANVIKHSLQLNKRMAETQAAGSRRLSYMGNIWKMHTRQCKQLTWQLFLLSLPALRIRRMYGLKRSTMKYWNTYRTCCRFNWVHRQAHTSTHLHTVAAKYRNWIRLRSTQINFTWQWSNRRQERRPTSECVVVVEHHHPEGQIKSFFMAKLKCMLLIRHVVQASFLSFSLSALRLAINRLTPLAVVNKQTSDGYRSSISMSLSALQ